MLVIRKPSPTEFRTTVIPLVNHSLGDDYTNPSAYCDEMLVAILDNRIAGYVKYDLFDEVIDGGDDALIDTVAVAPEFRRHGVGFLLVAAATAAIHMHGCKSICVVGWIEAGKSRANLDTCLTRNGYEPVEYRPRAYAESQYAWNCPSCSPCVCECNAQIYRRVNR